MRSKDASDALMGLDLGANLTAFFEMAMEMKWTRAEVVSRLCRQHYVGTVQVTCHTKAKDGLLWTGSSWYPGKVFKDGFQKTPRRPGDDPGESEADWGEAIKDSIVGNSWAYGFHFTVNPVVAATFGVQHVGRKSTAERQGEYECDYWDAECNRGILRQFQEKYGCPLDRSNVWKEDAKCWKKPCIRLDKLSDYKEFGPEQLCPNWGYAYLVKAEGIHVRVSVHDALGKDYSGEEEVFVPIGVDGSEILGAIPIYARNADGRKRTPAIMDFRKNWNYFKKMTVDPAHTKDGKGASTAIGAFIHNPNYANGDGPAEVEEELKRKRISNDLGPAVPQYQ